MRMDIFLYIVIVYCIYLYVFISKYMSRLYICIQCLLWVRIYRYFCTLLRCAIFIVLCHRVFIFAQYTTRVYIMYIPTYIIRTVIHILQDEKLSFPPPQRPLPYTHYTHVRRNAICGHAVFFLSCCVCVLYAYNNEQNCV